MINAKRTKAANINATNGREVWRFQPDGKPAFRGLIYWNGGRLASERVLFCADKYLYALNPNDGKPVADFGEQGWTLLLDHSPGDAGAAAAGPAMFENIIVIPGFTKDGWGYDAASGKWLWTFHTIPQPGELGYDTWDHTEDSSANCWSGTRDGKRVDVVAVTTKIGESFKSSCQSRAQTAGCEAHPATPGACVRSTFGVRVKSNNRLNPNNWRAIKIRFMGFMANGNKLSFVKSLQHVKTHLPTERR